MAEFHPELTEEQKSDRLLSMKLEALNIREAMNAYNAEKNATEPSLDGNFIYRQVEPMKTYVIGATGMKALADMPEDYAWAEGRIKEMNDQIKQTMAIPATDQLIQHLVEKFGIDPDKLRISVIQHQVEMAPDRDLEISVGTLEPANPVFDALNAMRNQFEHPSLRMVNRDESKDSRDPE